MNMHKIPPIKKRRTTRRADTSKCQAAVPSAGDVTDDAVEPSVAAATLVRLERGLEIKDVEAAHQRLTAALGQSQDLTIDCHQLVAVDTAGVQLLLAFHSAARAAGASVGFTGASSALAHALSSLGLLQGQISSSHE